MAGLRITDSNGVITDALDVTAINDTDSFAIIDGNGRGREISGAEVKRIIAEIAVPGANSITAAQLQANSEPEKAGQRSRIDAASAQSVVDERTRATGAEATLNQRIADERGRAAGVESGLDARITTNADDIDDINELPDSSGATDGQVLTADGAGNEAWEDVPTDPAIAAERGRAQQAEANLQTSIDDINELPDSSGATDGQVLTADGRGGEAWEDAPTDSAIDEERRRAIAAEGALEDAVDAITEVPDIGAQDAGRGLFANEAGTMPVWKDVREVPDNGDDGQGIIADGTGGYRWRDLPSGSGGVPARNSITPEQLQADTAGEKGAQRVRLGTASEVFAQSINTGLQVEIEDRGDADDELGVRIDNIRAVPAGGNDGQGLIAAGDGTYRWRNLPSGGEGGGTDGNDGADGLGQFIVFRRLNQAPPTPTGGTVPANGRVAAPADWSLSVPSGSNVLWVSFASGIPTEVFTWSVPARVTGERGASGQDGAQGQPGATGAPSTVAGPRGATGPAGDTGPAGADGDDGDTGPRGPQGEQGIQGVPGQDGQDGSGGVPGPNSITPEQLRANTAGEKGEQRVRIAAASETFAQATRRIVDDANYVPDIGPDTAGQILGNDGTDIEWVDAPAGGGGGGVSYVELGRQTAALQSITLPLPADDTTYPFLRINLQSGQEKYPVVTVPTSDILALREGGGTSFDILEHHQSLADQLQAVTIRVGRISGNLLHFNANIAGSSGDQLNNRTYTAVLYGETIGSGSGGTGTPGEQGPAGQSVILSTRSFEIDSPPATFAMAYSNGNRTLSGEMVLVSTPDGTRADIIGRDNGGGLFRADYQGGMSLALPLYQNVANAPISRVSIDVVRRIYRDGVHQTQFDRSINFPKHERQESLSIDYNSFNAILNPVGGVGDPTLPAATIVRTGFDAEVRLFISITTLDANIFATGYENEHSALAHDGVSNLNEIQFLNATVSDAGVLQGPPGPAGDDGDTGPRGPQGEQGIQGVPGQDGSGGGGGEPNDRSVSPVKFDTRDDTDASVFDEDKRTAIRTELGAVSQTQFDESENFEEEIQGHVFRTPVDSRTAGTLERDVITIPARHAFIRDAFAIGEGRMSVLFEVDPTDVADGAVLSIEIGGIVREQSGLDANLQNQQFRLVFDKVGPNRREVSPGNPPIDEDDGSAFGVVASMSTPTSGPGAGLPSVVALSIVSGTLRPSPTEGSFVEDSEGAKVPIVVVPDANLTATGADGKRTVIFPAATAPDNSITPRQLASENAAEQASFRARFAAASQADLTTEERARATGDNDLGVRIDNVRQVTDPASATDGQVLTATGTGSFLWEDAPAGGGGGGGGTVTTTVTTTNSMVENFEGAGVNTTSNVRGSSGAGSRAGIMSVNGNGWDFRNLTVRITQSTGNRNALNLPTAALLTIRASTDGITFREVALISLPAGQSIYRFKFDVGVHPINDGEIVRIDVTSPSGGNDSNLRVVYVMELIQTIVHSLTTAATATAERQYDATFDAVAGASFAIGAPLDTSALTRSFGTAPDGGELISRSGEGEFRARVAGVYDLDANIVVGIAAVSTFTSSTAFMEIAVQRDGESSFNVFERSTSVNLNGIGETEILDFSTKIGLNQNDRIQVRLRDANNATLTVAADGTFRIFNARTE